MGIEFFVGTIEDIYEDDDIGVTIRRMLVELCGTEVPLGTGEGFFSSGQAMKCDMGWSWWNKLKQTARSVVGQPCRTIEETYAWSAIFVDSRIPPSIIWPDGEETQSVAEPVYAEDPEVQTQITQLVNENGCPPEIRLAMQVFDLRGLHSDLCRVASALGHHTDEQSMIDLGRTYTSDDDRIDDDPDIQCLAHALAATNAALRLNSPLWFIK